MSRGYASDVEFMFDVDVEHIAVACPLVPVSTGLAVEAMADTSEFGKTQDSYQNESNVAVPCIGSGSSSSVTAVTVNVIKMLTFDFNKFSRTSVKLPF